MYLTTQLLRSNCTFLHQLNLTNDQSITIPTLQSLSTITQESANDERVEEDPETIRYPDRAPCKDGCFRNCFLAVTSSHLQE